MFRGGGASRCGGCGISRNLGDSGPILERGVEVVKALVARMEDVHDGSLVTELNELRTNDGGIFKGCPPEVEASCRLS
jgi:hypothetical protein